LLGFGVVAVLRCARVSASVPRRLIAAPLRSTRCPIRLVSSVASSPLQGATSRLDSFLRCITHVASSPRRSPSSLVVAAVPVAVCRHCHCRRCRLLVVIGLTAAAAATGLPRRPPYLAVHRRCRFGPPWRVSSFLVPAARVCTCSTSLATVVVPRSSVLRVTRLCCARLAVSQSPGRCLGSSCSRRPTTAQARRILPPSRRRSPSRRVTSHHQAASSARVSTSRERVWRHPACIARDMCAVCRPQSFRRHCRIAITVVVVIVISSPLMRPRQGSPLCASVQSSPGACRMCVPSLPSRLHESKSPLAAASTEASPHVVARRRSLLNVPLTTDSPSCAPHPRRLCVTRMSAGVCASSSRHRLDSSPCIFVVASFPVS
jgi:hypothetical protein